MLRHVRTSKRLHIVWALMASLALMVMGARPAQALLSTDYQFSVSTATYTPIAGGTVAIAGTNTTVPGGGQFNDTASAGPFNIGFSFQFDCLAYTQFTVSTSGVIYLSSLKSGSYNNDLANAPRYPIIAPWWDHQHIYNNGGAPGCTFTPTEGVRYALTGTAPNRVLAVEFNTQVADVSNAFWWAGCGLTMNRYQVRLYEGTNVIEFHYGSLWASSGQATAATIGIGAGTTNFLSVTPTGGAATVSSVTSNNTIAQHVALIPATTRYRFEPCYIRRVGTGGLTTPSMAPGDSLFVGQSVMYGNEISTTPYTLSFPAGSCPSHNYTLSVSGPNAADYIFTASGNQTQAGSIAAGASLPVGMLFRPAGVGPRPAFLTITDNTVGCSVIFYLAGTGTPRFSIVGDTALGAQTAAMNSGDTLLKERFGIRGSSANFTPFTVSNLASMGVQPGMSVNYAITGGLGQYTILPANPTLTDGQTNTPTITFTPGPSALGPQPATLTITADGATRTYVLYAAAAYPQINITTGGVTVDSSSLFFVNQFGCVGEQVLTVPLDLANYNFVNDTIWSTTFYEVDSTYSQLAPRYPFKRDQLGQLVQSPDYALTWNPPVAPLQANVPVTYPVIIVPGQTIRLYVTFVGQVPNKRFARMIMRTNALNFASADTNGLVTAGVMRVDLFARALSSYLADNTGGRPQAIVFPTTPIRTSVEQSFQLMNTGTCDMRIDPSRFEIVAGDVSEFEITQMPTSGSIATNGDLIFHPGESTTVRVKFTPSQVESRRATIRVVTNDSSIVIPGISSRGEYMIDLYGTGKSDLYAEGADLGIALMGGDASEHTHGVVRLRNTLDGPVIVTKFELAGINADEFMEDAGKPWPPKNKSKVIQGGQVLELGVEFAPKAGGIVGPREAEVRITLLSGNVLVAPITGIAATRTVEVTPSSLTFAQLTIGKQSRQNFFVKNTGTMVLKVQQPVVNAPDFTATSLQRTDLAPGQTEVVEVTFEPQQAGVSNGTILINSNGTNGQQQVALSGAARTRRSGDPDPSSTIASGNGPTDIVRNGLEEFSVSGVGGVRNAAGYALLQSVPNPAHDIVELGYMLPRGGEVVLELFDAQGGLLRVLDNGVRAEGETRLRVDVSSLPSGVYHYRLSAGGHTLVRSLTVLR